MRLIKTSTLRFEQFLGTKKPPYAILSHTWGNQEVTYDETLNPSQETRRKAGFQKIESCCGIARECGLSYAWVDTCCIDKRSSAELSEAINTCIDGIATLKCASPILLMSIPCLSVERHTALQTRFRLSKKAAGSLEAGHYKSSLHHANGSSSPTTGR